MPKVKQPQPQEKKAKRKHHQSSESGTAAGAAAAVPDEDMNHGDDDDIDDDIDGDDAIDGNGGDDDDHPTVTPAGRAELAAHCSKYVQTHRSIKELSVQVGVLRKALKDQEKNLLMLMQNVKLEEIAVDGSKITRSRKLQIFDE